MDYSHLGVFFIDEIPNAYFFALTPHIENIIGVDPCPRPRSIANVSKNTKPMRRMQTQNVI
jgi:hypothetical protein